MLGCRSFRWVIFFPWVLCFYPVKWAHWTSETPKALGTYVTIKFKTISCPLQLASFSRRFLMFGTKSLN